MAGVARTAMVVRWGLRPAEERDKMMTNRAPMLNGPAGVISPLSTKRQKLSSGKNRVGVSQAGVAGRQEIHTGIHSVSG